jgi:hypothetical protein
MKAILEFDLPNDEANFDMAVKASDYYSALWDIWQFLRREDVTDKGDSEEPLPPNVVWEAFWQIMSDHEINF